MKINNINALLLATAPIFAVYSFAGLTMSFFMIWICVVLNILNFIASKDKSFKSELSLFMSVLFLGFVNSLFNYNETYYSSKLFINNLFPIISFFMALLLCTKRVNIDLFIKTIVFIAMIASLICLFQRLQVVTAGSYSNNFFIPGLEVKRDLDNFSNRPSAFFTEPAHLAIYLLPTFYLLLQLKKLEFSIIIGLGILSCGSTTGFILMFVLFLINSIKNSINKTTMLLSLLSMAALYAIVMYVSPDILLDNYEKLTTSETSGSRLLGPLDYFRYFDIIQLFFGIGINQLSAFLRSHGFILLDIYGNEMDMNYANAIIYMVICYGVVGGYILFKYLISLYKLFDCKKDVGYFVILIGILLSDQVLFNMNFLYPLSCVILLTNYNIISEK